MRDRMRGAAALLAPWMALAAVFVFEGGKRWHL